MSNLLRLKEWVSVDEAAYLYTLLDKSCQVQLMVEAAGLPKRLVPDEEAAYNFKMASDPVSFEHRRCRLNLRDANFCRRKHYMSSSSRAINWRNI